MNDRTPIHLMVDLRTLDDKEVVDGYRDGTSGEVQCGDNRSRSYWHGWRNGMVDGGHAEADWAQSLLAKAYAARCGILPLLTPEQREKALSGAGLPEEFGGDGD